MKTIAPLEIENCYKGFSLYTDSFYYYLVQKKVRNYEPQVGDYRIQYSYLELGTFVTILGEYKKGKIGKYKKMVLFADVGLVSVDKIIGNYCNRETLQQNIVRTFGVLGVFVGVIVCCSFF